MVSKQDIDNEGNIRYRNNYGQLHNQHGPAVWYVDDSKHWYINGKQHREDGPASEYSNGDRVWYQNNVCHRTDGPAIITNAGYEKWYVNGIQFQRDQSIPIDVQIALILLEN